MELSELHNPHCKLHASQSFEDHSPVRERRHSDVSDIFLSPEAYKATQAVEFIAEHLRNEDEYVQVRNNLKSKINDGKCPWTLSRCSLYIFCPGEIFHVCLQLSPDIRTIIGYRRFRRKYKGNNNISLWDPPVGAWPYPLILSHSKNIHLFLEQQNPGGQKDNRECRNKNIRQNSTYSGISCVCSNTCWMLLLLLSFLRYGEEEKDPPYPSSPPTLVSQFGMKTLGVVRTLYLDGITLWTLWRASLICEMVPTKHHHNTPSPNPSSTMQW